MNLPDIAGWLIAGGWAVGAGWSAANLRRARRRIAEADDFLHWARTTAITVTEDDGTMFAATLTQLHREPPERRTWVKPVLVTFWPTGSIQEPHDRG